MTLNLVIYLNKKETRELRKAKTHYTNKVIAELNANAANILEWLNCLKLINTNKSQTQTMC